MYTSETQTWGKFTEKGKKGNERESKSMNKSLKGRKTKKKKMSIVNDTQVQKKKKKEIRMIYCASGIQGICHF